MTKEIIFHGVVLSEYGQRSYSMQFTKIFANIPGVEKQIMKKSDFVFQLKHASS